MADPLSEKLRRQKEEDQANIYRKEARLLRRSQLEDAPPPYLPSKGHHYQNSMQKGDLPATPTRPTGMVVNERLPIRPANTIQRTPVRNDTAPSMPMSHMTEGSWATLPTMSTQPTLPKTYVPGRLAPLPNEDMPSRFST